MLLLPNEHSKDAKMIKTAQNIPTLNNSIVVRRKIWRKGGVVVGFHEVIQLLLNYIWHDNLFNTSKFSGNKLVFKSLQRQHLWIDLDEQIFQIRSNSAADVLEKMCSGSLFRSLVVLGMKEYLIESLRGRCFVILIWWRCLESASWKVIRRYVARFITEKKQKS